MALTVKNMIAAADAVVPRISPAQAQEMIAGGDVVVVDVRDAAEVAKSGKVAGAVNLPRGLLEFRADPASPSHDPALDPAKPVIVYCAAGSRAALSGKLLKDMGFDKVYNLGGFKDWADSGGAIDPASDD